ncbi:SDR family NAD(P)-dependent oxidoreductase [Mucilaginibacter sp. E4BP6]|uniref:SDR family NAD(P)-dependent oxidoreductase n=1 Tax=Mucilaginibacter sp. E4BP6 TaxID=2723089 RepID=UPI0015C9B309|nr:SDR family NAD(P)-dependent oxidoreductase [Mucilaginibacter sp. E4BP6]NYE67014.1 NAD(P)-dependent dehydrogenase (short-subunit alcohol dehydrogenase family) [Mucilaginibacter sp. E4BP6]
METKQIVIITGAARKTGIGLEAARQLCTLGYKVIITAREIGRAQEAAQILIDEGLDAVPMALDVANEEMVKSVAEEVGQRFGKLDVLINNATEFPDQYRIETAEIADVMKAFESSFFGAWRMIKYFTPLLRKSENPRIVNCSSGSGSLQGEEGEYTLVNPWRDFVSVYSLTKLAINGLTLKAAHDLKDDHILVNAPIPGMTATYDILEKAGGRPVSEGAQSIVYAATLSKGGPTGKHFKDGREVSW